MHRRSYASGPIRAGLFRVKRLGPEAITVIGEPDTPDLMRGGGNIPAIRLGRSDGGKGDPTVFRANRRTGRHGDGSMQDGLNGILHLGLGSGTPIGGE